MDDKQASEPADARYRSLDLLIAIPPYRLLPVSSGCRAGRGGAIGTRRLFAHRLIYRSDCKIGGIKLSLHVQMHGVGNMLPLIAGMVSEIGH
jgi:hypothetical protein